jgi:hypothetical protein
VALTLAPKRPAFQRAPAPRETSSFARPYRTSKLSSPRELALERGPERGAHPAFAAPLLEGRLADVYASSYLRIYDAIAATNTPKQRAQLPRTLGRLLHAPDALGETTKSLEQRPHVPDCTGGGTPATSQAWVVPRDRGRTEALGPAVTRISLALTAELRYLQSCRRCQNEGMSRVQNNGGTRGGITGRGFMPGRSGNPGGRPKGLGKATRALVGEDGVKLTELWWTNRLR